MKAEMCGENQNRDLQDKLNDLYWRRVMVTRCVNNEILLVVKNRTSVSQARSSRAFSEIQA